MRQVDVGDAGLAGFARGKSLAFVGARAAVVTVAQLIDGNVPGGLRWRYNSS